MAKKENFALRVLKGIGYGIISVIMCAFLVLSMIAVSAMTGGAVWFKIVIALCCMIVTLGLYFNWAVKAARSDRDAVKFHGAEYDRFMPVKMAFLGPVVSYISLIVLILSKCGFIEDIFNIYLLINMPFLPFVDAFTSGRTLEFLTVPGLLGLALLTFLQSAAIYVTYILTYRDVDVVSKVMYKKQ